MPSNPPSPASRCGRPTQRSQSTPKTAGALAGGLPSGRICAASAYNWTVPRCIAALLLTLPLLLTAQDRFWEKPPAQWSEEQLENLLRDSPWAQPAEGSKRTGLTANSLTTFLATAKPIRLAEAEWVRRRIRKPEIQRAIRDARAEFNEYIEKHAGNVIVLAVACEPNALADAQDARKMEEDSYLKVGKKKFKLLGHFPPTPSDPLLRLMFQRDVDPKAKTLEFEFYLPGGPSPYRQVSYKVADLAGEM